MMNNKYHYNISLNKITHDKSKNLKNRSFISVFIFFYYLIIIILSYLSDSSSTWSPFYDHSDVIYSEQIRGIFALFLLLIIYIPLFLSTKEVNSLIFKDNKISLIWLLLISFIFYFGPNFSYWALNYYRQALIDLGLSSTLVAANRTIYLFVTTIVFSIFTNVILCNILLKYYKLANFKNLITLNFLMFLIPFGFMSICFLAMIKSWFVILFILMITVSTDVFSYLSGLFFGKNKMSPIISPNKTWEGAIGGFLITFLLSSIYSYLLTLDNHGYDLLGSSFQFLIGIELSLTLSWLYISLITILMCVFSILGDLLFSYIKRSFNIKDYSKILKSHGGILDRSDSLIFSSSIFTIGLFFITSLSSSNLFG